MMYRWENTGSGCHERPSRVNSLGFGRTYGEPSEIEVKDATPVRVLVKVKLAPGSAPVQ